MKTYKSKILAFVSLVVLSLIPCGFATQEAPAMKDNNDTAMNSLYSQGKWYLKTFESASLFGLQKSINQYAIDMNSVLVRVSITSTTNSSNHISYAAAVIFARE